MDYRDNLYPKIPFYMTYPMQNMYLTEMEYEEPDRMMIQMEVEQLYRKLMEESKPAMQEEQIPSYFDMVPMSIGGPPPGGRPPGRPPHGGGCEDNWLCSMVGVLFGTELYRRRCRHRRCRRWW